MTAREMITAIAVVLRVRGHDAELSTMPCGRTPILCVFVGGQLVARDSAGSVRVPAALVFNGRTHLVPEGCDVCTVTPGSRFATVERIVAAIEKRMAARAKSLPVPTDASAIVRDP